MTRSRKRHHPAADDLWKQIFGRLAADPAAAIVDPEYDAADDRKLGHAALRAVGWSEEWIAASDEAHAQRTAEAPSTSPGVNRHVEAQYKILADAIEGAMGRLGHTSNLKIARGVEPRVGPFASKTNVIMTDESIVTVGSFLFRYCGLVARAFVRTLRLDPWLWEADTYKTGSARTLLGRNPGLAAYWLRIYVSFAISGTHVLVPYKPSSMEEVLLMEQVARAMEIFAIAHEYGHHHLNHGRRIEADPKAEEFDADAFAMRISDEVEKLPVITGNPYLPSGAGALILLMSLETLRSVETAVGARQVDLGTHPSAIDRINRFETIRMLFPDEHRWLKGYRTASQRIMQLVHESTMQMLQSIPPDLREALRQRRRDFEQWKDLTG